MKLWIARDKDGKVCLFTHKPYDNGFGTFYSGAYAGIFLPDAFPELTFENSPKQVEIKIVEEDEKD